VVFENDHLLVVYKEAGMLAHGAGGLDESVLSYLEGKLPPSLSFAPGPLHRLDRGTSGLLTFSKSLAGAQAFSSALAGREIGKRYLGVLQGEFRGSESMGRQPLADGESRTTSVAGPSASGDGPAGKEARTRARAWRRTERHPWRCWTSAPAGPTRSGRRPRPGDIPSWGTRSTAALPCGEASSSTPTNWTPAVPRSPFSRS
jgi:23S rRNA-/tRNA-specific pseudouridylate synthase